MTVLPMPRFMRPVEVWLFRAATGGDERQVPASGASIAVAYVGATVIEGATCYDWGDTPVSVGGGSRVQLGDTLQVGADETRLLTVDGISADGRTLSLAAQGTTPIVLLPADRLIVALRAPLIYSDSAGMLPISGNVVTVNSRGYTRFYCPEPSVDYLASGGGLPNALWFQDVEAGWVSASRPTLNVLDFPTFQAAHDALPAEGGTIFVPAGLYKSTSFPCAFKGLVVTKPVALVGEASGYGEALSQIHHDMTGANDVDAIFLNVLSRVAVRNLFIKWPSAAQGSGRGIRWYVAGHPVRMAALTIENVIVEGSPSLAFEFVCDGHRDNYVSKLEMIGCTAFNSAGGGSLFLGGAGTNNNWFERCEFNGPGFGGFHNVLDCTVTENSAVVLAPGFAVAPAVGDVVFGMGIAVGTTVVSVNTTSTPRQLVLSKPAIQAPLFPPGTTTLSFHRPVIGAGQLPRGHAHLMRTSISRFNQCSFQGPGGQPAISTDLVSNDLALRDSYRERAVSPPNVHTFLINGMTNLLIDGLYHQFNIDPNLLLKTGPLGLRMGRIANAQLKTSLSTPTNTDVIVLSNPSDELVVDNSFEFGENSHRSLDAFGSSPSTTTIASAGTLVLPGVGDDAFIVSGATNITSVTPLRANRRVTLIFTGTASVINGGTLKLNQDFSGGANRTITLVGDGTNWYEASRSFN